MATVQGRAHRGQFESLLQDLGDSRTPKITYDSRT